MYNFRVVTDPDECRHLWQCAMPRAAVWDVWECRGCFDRHFQRPMHFVAAENGRGLAGLLPLSWIDEERRWGFFPGETWEGKTWIEQNRIVAADADVLAGLLDRCPGHYHLRYLLPMEAAGQAAEIDEIGYLFLPPDCDYDIENYYRLFSHKSAKRLRRDLEAVAAQGVRYRYDRTSDFEHLVDLNLRGFGERSYFADARFRAGFRDLMDLLAERGWLRLTTVLIGDEVVAVDMGCLYNGVYTLLAGGADRNVPGVAKFINVHHMIRGCREHMECLDFLCGDFSWKKLFHLTPRPLYVLSNVPCAVAGPCAEPAMKEADCV